MAKRYVQYGCRLDKLLRAVWLLDPATMQAWVDQVWHVVSTPEGIKQKPTLGLWNREWPALICRGR
jgi:hypothetical protein